jgi:hypothetical protein
MFNFPFIENDFDSITYYQLLSQVFALAKENSAKITEIKSEANNYIKNWLESNINNFMLDTNYVENEEKLIIKNSTLLTSASCLHAYKNDTMIIGKEK